MPGSEVPRPGVWQQLRRRRVMRTVVTYASVGFAVLEAVAFVISRYDLADSAGRVVMGTLVLGFPLAVVLAWTYDLTPEGIVRTPDDTSTEASEASRSRISGFAWLVL